MMDDLFELGGADGKQTLHEGLCIINQPFPPFFFFFFFLSLFKLVTM